MMEGQVEIAGKSGLIRRCPNGQVGSIEIRVGVEIELPPMRDGVNVEISGALLVRKRRSLR